MSANVAHLVRHQRPVGKGRAVARHRRLVLRSANARKSAILMQRLSACISGRPRLVCWDHSARRQCRSLPRPRHAAVPRSGRKRGSSGLPRQPSRRNLRARLAVHLTKGAEQFGPPVDISLSRSCLTMSRRLWRRDPVRHGRGGVRAHQTPLIWTVAPADSASGQARQPNRLQIRLC